MGKPEKGSLNSDFYCNSNNIHISQYAGRFGVINIQLLRNGCRGQTVAALSQCSLNGEMIHDHKPVRVETLLFFLDTGCGLEN